MRCRPKSCCSPVSATSHTRPGQPLTRHAVALAPCARSPHVCGAAEAAVAPRTPAQAAAEKPPSWKVRYGWRVELPDGTYLAAVEMSVRGGLQAAAGTLRGLAESLRGGSMSGGSVRGGSVRGGSLHAAAAALRDITTSATPTAPPLHEDVLEMASATVVEMPPADWPGWRPVRVFLPEQAEPPAVLQALHAATAAGERTRGGAQLAGFVEGRPAADAPAAARPTFREH